MRLLFVDKDIESLRGLNHGLRQLSDDLILQFVRGGKEALDTLDMDEPDAIVSGMRLPDMTAAELLNEVKELHPHTIRIILSDGSDEDAVLRMVGKSHLFMTKPCDPEVLMTTVVRACALRDLMSRDELRRLIPRLERLPSLPLLYVELVQEIRSPNASIPRVAGIVSRDVAMVAKILQLANSAYFGLLCRVTNPEAAVMTLGLKTIQSLALSAQVFSQFDRQLAEVFKMSEIVDHCVAVGGLARALARSERRGLELIDDSLTAGLLHDVGKLVLASNIPDQYGEALRMAKSTGIPTWEAEQQVLGCSHAEIGAYLMTLWGQPEAVVEAIAFHHTPSNAHAKSFGPLMPVHVTNAWEREGQRQDPEAPSLVDADYVESIGMTGRLPDWRMAYEDVKQGNR